MGINLAPSAQISSSSYIDPYEPSRVVDGITNQPTSRWLCGSLPGWIMFDLKNSYWLSQWSLLSIGGNGGFPTWPANYCMTAFSLQYNLTGNDPWVSVDNVVNNTAIQYVKSFNPVKARYWRVFVPYGGGMAANPAAVSIMEVQLIQADPTSNKLSSLVLKNASDTVLTLTPSFTSQTVSYTASVPFDTSTVTVTPAAQDTTGASISVNGTAVANGNTSAPINLTAGAVTNISVVVTPKVGDPLTYTIAVTRAQGPQLSNLTVQSGATVFQLNPAFSKGTTTYTTDIDYNTTGITVTPTAEMSSSTITVNGQSVGSGYPSQVIQLNVGSNNITVAVTNGGVTGNYTINAVRHSPYLIALTLNNGTSDVPFDQNFAKTTLSYSTAVENGIENVTITPLSEDSTASVTVNGIAVQSGAKSQQIPVTLSANTITVVVTPKAGTAVTYTVSVIRRAPLYLSNLVLKSGMAVIPLNPSTFSGTTYKYTANAGNKTSLSVVPTLAAGTSAIITANGTTVSSGGSVTVQLPLAGANIIEVLLTSNTLINKYIIEVIRTN